MFIIIMGVSGSGKSTVGRQLAIELGWEFFDGDDYHSASNIKKMQRGIPLDDQDRLPWLERLNLLVRAKLAENKNGVLACSALKESYRSVLVRGGGQIHWVYLKGEFGLIKNRLFARRHPFMHPELLQTQFDSLEAPIGALVVDITLSLEVILELIKTKLHLV